MRTFHCVTFAVATGILVSAVTASAGNRLEVLHAFAINIPRTPYSALIQATDGNFYGTSPYGGAFYGGTIFKITPNGTLTVLHDFLGGIETFGVGPLAALIQASDGNFYGTTYSGGTGYGTAFKITPSGIFTVLHVFTGGTDGGRPNAALIQASDGNFYGTTTEGISGPGTVFKMTSSGTVTTLHSIGMGAALIQATDGNFYGTTSIGGTSAHGTVFKMTPSGTLTVLHSFTGGMDGASPSALIQAADGNFYGTTGQGGSFVPPCDSHGCGTVFRLTPDGTLTVLHVFTAGADAANPQASLIQAADGNFYGTSTYGGAFNSGTVFQMTPGGILTVLHEFTGGFDGTDGAFPNVALIQAADGNFYGTTDGAIAGSGTVFKITSSGTLTTLIGGNGGTDGAAPLAAVIQATDGNFYGTTQYGGTLGYGTVFQMTPDGVLTVLHAFTGGPTDGAAPLASLIQATDGNFYGTTSAGGSSGYGTVFKITPSGVLTVLHSFTGGTEGAQPYASLIQATDGNFYGTTSGVGSNFGTVFRMTPTGTVTTLHVFQSFGGPHASLIQATDGDLYGTIPRSIPYGAVFKVTLTGVVTVLHAFVGSDGSTPQGSLIQGTDGNFYGTTSGRGDTILSSGTIFKMTPAGVLTVLHVFKLGTADGVRPGSSLIEATDGNFYGTTQGGPLPQCFIQGLCQSFGYGTVFRMTPGGTVTVLHVFTGGIDGASPSAALIQASDGNFYGSTAAGGASGTGVVFRLSTKGVTMSVGDFDGDTKADVTVFRPSTGSWFTLQSSTSAPSTVAWGASTDIPVPGDYDGDGKVDIAVYRPGSGTWYILASSAGFSSVTWGSRTDVPVPADYDGDGNNDIAVYRPGTGTWYVLQSSTSTLSSVVWGAATDMPVPGDYDGDGRTDIAVYRPSTGTWFILQSSTAAPLVVAWGGSGTDVPVVGDYDGDGRTDIAVYRRGTGTWYILASTAGLSTVTWGSSSDVCVPADYDGDGKTDIAVYRPATGTWYIRQSSTSTLSTITWGTSTDIAVLRRP